MVGGGYIAVELGGILSAFGSDVTMIVRRDGILGGFDVSKRISVHRSPVCVCGVLDESQLCTVAARSLTLVVSRTHRT